MLTTPWPCPGAAVFRAEASGPGGARVRSHPPGPGHNEAFDASINQGRALGGGTGRDGVAGAASVGSAPFSAPLGDQRGSGWASRGDSSPIVSSHSRQLQLRRSRLSRGGPWLSHPVPKLPGTVSSQSSPFASRVSPRLSHSSLRLAPYRLIFTLDWRY